MTENYRLSQTDAGMDPIDGLLVTLWHLWGMEAELPMSEEEWLASTGPAAMLRHFSATSAAAHRRPPSERKLAL